jgi:hypothetical protein
MPAERALHLAIFILILVGLGGVSAWAAYKYVDHPILQIAGIALSWGVILLVLYVVFQKLGWDWWS